MAKEFYWLFFFVPTFLKNLILILSPIILHPVLHPFIHRFFMVTEAVGIIAFLVSVGVCIGKQLGREKETSIEEMRKEQILELRKMQNEFLGKYDPLRVRAQNAEVKLKEAEITIHYFKKLLADAEKRTGQTAEEANERAVVSLS